MIFLHEICNFLYFPCENMGADISTWNRKPVFHVWKSTCILCFIMYGILPVSHMDIRGHVFLHEWGIIYISDMKIWAYTSLLELYTFPIWKSQWNFTDMKCVIKIWGSNMELKFSLFHKRHSGHHRFLVKYLILCISNV